MAESLQSILHKKIAERSPISIENKVGNTTSNTSIELPGEITALITGSDFWVLAKTNRYKMLARQGHLSKLLHLAKEATSKDNPANWFAKACSKARWDKYTLPYFAKLQEVVEKADRVARRIGGRVNKFIYKQIWNGVNVDRWAVMASESQHAKPGQTKERHFAWMCLNEKLILSRMQGNE